MAMINSIHPKNEGELGGGNGDFNSRIRDEEREVEEILQLVRENLEALKNTMFLLETAGSRETKNLIEQML